MELGFASGQPVPLRTGSPEEFRALRFALLAASYDEASICHRTGAASLFEFQIRSAGRQTGTRLDDALDALILLLLDGEPLAEDRVRSLLSAEMTGLLEALGILARLPDRPDQCYGTVLLYPFASLYFAADRHYGIDRGPLAPDTVFSGISRGSRMFLSCLPDSPCESLLDICAGMGIAALLAAHRVRHAWACDLGARSVRFAEFNCRLNGIENVTCAQGDLYAPVQGLTFDRIVAHPPYVPSSNRKLLYRDGGTDGEQILRRIVEDLPRYLRPGGRFYGFAMGTDREDDPFEQRLRRWLGAHAPEFDVMVVAIEVRKKRQDKIWLLEAGIPEEFDARLKVTAVALAAIVIERMAQPHPAVTARTSRSTEAGNEAIEWFANWHTRSAAPGFDAVLLESRPHMSARFRLMVEHAPKDGSLVTAGFELRSDYPFNLAVPCPGWLAVVVGACDGKRTVREVFEAMKQQNVIDPRLTPERFAHDIRELIARGFLELDEFPLPLLKDLHS